MKSTLNSPILFFEDFLTEENLKLHEENFYKDIINPSQQSFDEYKEGGYITFTPSLYENDEDSLKQVFYIDTLISILENEKKNSIDLLKRKIEEIKINGNSTDYYIQNNLRKLNYLKDNISVYCKYKKQIHKTIDDIQKVVSNHSIKAPKNNSNRNRLNDGFFKPKIKKTKIDKIYDIALELNLLNEDIVSKDTFYNAFSSPNPLELSEKIYFTEFTLYSVLFLETISKYFGNITPTSIGKSELFYTKAKRALLTSGNYSKNKSSLKQKTENHRYKEIIKK